MGTTRKAARNQQKWIYADLVAKTHDALNQASETGTAEFYWRVKKQTQMKTDFICLFVQEVKH